MHPLLLNAFPVYYAMWVCAAGTALTVGTLVASRNGLPANRAAGGIALVTLSIILGSKLLYMAEATWFPADDYVPPYLRSSIHGFRIPGGIVFVALAMPLIGRAMRLPWKRFGDLVTPFMALALVFIRFGCFLNGCCFGKVSTLPWAMRFPKGSWVTWYQKTQGWIPLDAAVSLPVHPLQLYFLCAATATLALLLWQERRGVAAGTLQLVFYVMFFSTTAVLEPLRQNSLTLNKWVVPCAAALAAFLLLRRGSFVPDTGPIVRRKLAPNTMAP